MAINFSGFVGKVLGQVMKSIMDWFRNWYTQRRLEEEEQRRKALEAHHANEKERESAEGRIAKVGEEEKKQAEKDAEEMKHHMMLEHLKETNKR